MSEIGDLECPVCLQEYTETGEFVPRILPCHHTVCECCIKRLLGDGSTVECPLCRKKINAEKGFKTFPQNKYILSQLKKISEEMKPAFENCKIHTKSLNLYCIDCQKEICLDCLSENHRKHDVVFVDYWKRVTCDQMMKCTNVLDKNLKSDKLQLLKIKTGLKMEAENCIKSIQTQKSEVMAMFDRRLDYVKEHQTQTTRSIDELISKIKNTIVLLKQTTDDVDSEKLTCKMVSQKRNTVTKIKTIMEKSLSERWSIVCLKHEIIGTNQAEEAICGEITKVKKIIQFATAGKKSKMPPKKKSQQTNTDHNDIQETPSQNRNQNRHPGNRPDTLPGQCNEQQRTSIHYNAQEIAHGHYNEPTLHGYNGGPEIPFGYYNGPQGMPIYNNGPQTLPGHYYGPQGTSGYYNPLLRTHGYYNGPETASNYLRISGQIFDPQAPSRYLGFTGHIHSPESPSRYLQFSRHFDGPDITARNQQYRRDFYGP